MGFMWLVTLNIFVSNFLYKIVYRVFIRYINYHASDSLMYQEQNTEKKTKFLFVNIYYY